MTFPKLMVVAEFPPNSPTLMVQCLRGYPAAQIFWWSCRPETTTVFGQKYARHFYCRLPHRLLPQRRFKPLKCWILDQLWLPYASRHLAQTLAEVQPDQIWVNLYGWAINAAYCAQITARHRTHVTLWDFPDNEHHQQIWGAQRCQRVLQRALAIYQNATSCETISKPMWEELVRETGRQDAIIVHSGLEASDVARLAAPAPESDGIIRIAYAGSILFPEVFKLFVTTLARIRQQMQASVRLEFFGASCTVPRSWFDPTWMHDHGVVDEAGLFQALRRCAWGFVPMEIRDHNPRYNRYSFPNKFGTFLAGGLPILLMSGSESSAARMFQEHPVGVHLDHTRLAAHLLAVLALPHPRTVFLKAMQTCAQTEFYMPRMRQAVWQCLGVTDG